VKPHLRQWQNSGFAVGQMNNAHLGRPLSPVKVHGRSGPSQIGMLCCFRVKIEVNKQRSS
jgi:hypothetical protein